MGYIGVTAAHISRQFLGGLSLGLMVATMTSRTLLYLMLYLCWSLLHLAVVQHVNQCLPLTTRVAGAVVLPQMMVHCEDGCLQMHSKQTW